MNLGYIQASFVDLLRPLVYTLKVALMQDQTPDIQGIVDEALPNTLFRVTLSTGEQVLCYLAGKMRLHRIKVLVGDKVLVKLEPYGGKARIMRRL